MYSEEENNPEPHNVRTSLRSMLTSSNAGGSTQMMSDGGTMHPHVLGSPVSMASIGNNEVHTTEINSEIHFVLCTIYCQACLSDHLPPPFIHSSLVWERSKHQRVA